jgi:hypothetical protein
MGEARKMRIFCAVCSDIPNTTKKNIFSREILHFNHSEFFQQNMFKAKEIWKSGDFLFVMLNKRLVSSQERGYREPYSYLPS